MSISLALLGAGRIGWVHAEAIAGNPGARLVAVADVFEDAALRLAEAYGGEFRKTDAIAAANDIDAVLICTPTDTHADLIEKFSRAGKAVFCEKPIDLDIARVKTCLQKINEAGTPLMVGFNRRFDPHFMALKASISAGDIGGIEMVNIISRDPGAPPPDYIKTSGGIFKDMTIHDFDMARFILDEEIESVIASASVLVDVQIGRLGDFDSANVILRTASGRQCAISNSRRASYGYDQRIEVHGSKGMIRAQNQRPVAIELATATGYTKPPLFDFFMTRYTAAYAAEISAFIASLARNAPVSPDGEDGLQALAIAEAALKSVWEERSVKISEVL